MQLSEYTKIVKEFLVNSEVKKEPILYKDLHTVMYTDGGFMPATKECGWGIHFYSGIIAEKPQYSHAKTPCSTKGYLPKNDIGIGELMQSLIYVDCYGSIDHEHATNNIAELVAVNKALEIVLQLKLPRVMILSDSRYALMAVFTKSREWAANNWVNRSGIIKNLDIIQSSYKLLTQLDEMGCEITHDHVYGHKGNIGNDTADMNATAGREITSELEFIISDNKYWRYKPDYHKLLNESKWFIDSDMVTEVGEHTCYFLGDYGEKSVFAGKPLNTSALACVLLPQRDIVLDNIYSSVVGVESLTNIFIGNLNNILRPINYQRLSRNVDDIRYKTRQSRFLMSNDHILVEHISTPRMAFDFFSKFYYIQELLIQYLDGKLDKQMSITDITENIYITSSTGNKTTNVFLLHEQDSVVVNVEYIDEKFNKATIDITLTVGIDLPRRNTLSTIRNSKPTMKVLTVRDMLSRTIAYYVLIELTDSKDDKSYGIYCGAYSNFTLLPIGR